MGSVVSNFIETYCVSSFYHLLSHSQCPAQVSIASTSPRKTSFGLSRRPLPTERVTQEDEDKKIAHLEKLLVENNPRKDEKMTLDEWVQFAMEKNFKETVLIVSNFVP